MNFVLARALGNACARANDAKLQINGAIYRNVSHLYADIGFMNALWNGKALGASDSDAELQTYLRRAHSTLRWATWAGVCLFLSAIVLGFINAT